MPTQLTRPKLLASPKLLTFLASLRVFPLYCLILFKLSTAVLFKFWKKIGQKQVIFIFLLFFVYFFKEKTGFCRTLRTYFSIFGGIVYPIPCFIHFSCAVIAKPCDGIEEKKCVTIAKEHSGCKD